MKLFLISAGLFLVLLGILVSVTDLCIACGCVICFNPDYNRESDFNSAPVFMQLSPRDFSSKLGGEIVLIDIRTLDEFNSGKIAGATNLDFYSASFMSELDLLDKNKTYLIYCRSGSRSNYAINIMKDLGFSEVYELKGGINNWVSAGLPVQ